MITNICENPSNKPCINASNVNLYLKKTFEFIQANQISLTGYLLETVFTLKVSLKKSQFSGVDELRQSASNSVAGIISSVTDTNVVIIAKSPCENKYSEYTIEYSKIIFFNSGSVSSYTDEYLKMLDTLPRICYEEENQYSEMLISLKKALKENMDSQNLAIQIMFSGVKSRNFHINNVVVRGNLIILENFFVFPITFISGYVLVNTCATENIVKTEGGTYV